MRFHQVFEVGEFTLDISFKRAREQRLSQLEEPAWLCLEFQVDARATIYALKGHLLITRKRQFAYLRRFPIRLVLSLLDFDFELLPEKLPHPSPGSAHINGSLRRLIDLKECGRPFWIILSVAQDSKDLLDGSVDYCSGFDFQHAIHSVLNALCLENFTRSF